MFDFSASSYESHNINNYVAMCDNKVGDCVVAFFEEDRENNCCFQINALFAAFFDVA